MDARSQREQMVDRRESINMTRQCGLLRIMCSVQLTSLTRRRHFFDVRQCSERKPERHHNSPDNPTSKIRRCLINNCPQRLFSIARDSSFARTVCTTKNDRREDGPFKYSLNDLNDRGFAKQVSHSFASLTSQQARRRFALFSLVIVGVGNPVPGLRALVPLVLRARGQDNYFVMAK